MLEYFNNRRRETDDAKEGFTENHICQPKVFYVSFPRVVTHGDILPAIKRRLIRCRFLLSPSIRIFLYYIVIPAAHLLEK